MRMYVCECVCVCARAGVRVCVCVCVCVYAREHVLYLSLPEPTIRPLTRSGTVDSSTDGH